MSGPSGTWTTTSGGGGGAVLAALVPVAVVCAVAYVTAQAVSAIPTWVFVAIPAGMITGAAWVVRCLVRHNRRQAVLFTARCEQRHAVDAAEKEERRRHRLEVAAASAPVIHNTVVLDRDALEAMVRGRAQPATVIHQEVER